VTIGNDASGLSPTTTASASNLAKIGDLVLADPVLSEIIKEARTVIPVHGEITSTNYLLGQDPTIVGIKTGTTEEAGSCFVLGAKDGQNTVVIAVMNVGTNGAIDESYNLYQQARTAAKNQLVVKKGAEIGVLKAGWLAEPVKMYANLDLSANIWDADDVSLSLDIPDNLINQSGEIGTLKLQTKTGQLSIPVYINQQFSGPNLLYKLLN
jgi:D-alanyl-D-alanine carboxypeptidase (penicillin-binding protein 5/6)